MIRRVDHHCRVFMFCKVARQMELDGKCTLLHECNITERGTEEKEPQSLVSVLASLQLIYGEVIQLFWGNKKLE